MFGYGRPRVRVSSPQKYAYSTIEQYDITLARVSKSLLLWPHLALHGTVVMLLHARQMSLSVWIVPSVSQYLKKVLKKKGK